ncbi:MAG: crossover junction endodeoxyribonuclease RuvC [Candidatus Levybacteria bacterium]|nr:crossover junction endodeoxyribonuclease RuvC [Candidatus Levybacteria bacterium]
MRIIGVDPGLGRLGWGVIDVDGNKHTAWNYGCIETSSTFSEEQRIKQVYNELTTIFEENNPEVLAIEELFFSRNVTTAFMVGQARGVVLLIAAQNNIPVISYNPNEVKVAVTGYGKADKKQIAQMVKIILKLPKLPKHDDTTDALAIALTHAFSQKMKKQARV